jgi:hypothetical protein
MSLSKNTKYMGKNNKINKNKGKSNSNNFSKKTLKSNNTQKVQIERSEKDLPAFKSNNVFSELELDNSQENNNINNVIDISITPNNIDSENNVVVVVASNNNLSNILNTQDLQNDEGWIIPEKKSKQKKVNKNDVKAKNHKDNNFDIDDNNTGNINDINDIDDNYQDEKENNNAINNTGEHLKFVSKWNVWVHLNNSTNWTAESYKIVYTIDNISSFWRFVNNINNLDLDKYQFYVMKDKSCPTWEDESNRNGGTCSIRLPRDRMEDVIEQLSILVLNDTFNDQPEEINGLSFGVKVNWGLIKIWNSNYENDISAFVPQYLTKKYLANPRYKKNEPEF